MVEIFSTVKHPTVLAIPPHVSGGIHEVIQACASLVLTREDAQTQKSMS